MSERDLCGNGDCRNRVAEHLADREMCFVDGCKRDFCSADCLQAHTTAEHPGSSGIGLAAAKLEAAGLLPKPSEETSPAVDATRDDTLFEDADREDLDERDGVSVAVEELEPPPEQSPAAAEEGAPAEGEASVDGTQPAISDDDSDRVHGYLIHPAAKILPMMSESELDAMTQDIKANGLRKAITMFGVLTILDGRNRLVCCFRAGVEPRFEQYEGDDPIGFVLSANVHRRHLNESQRAMVGARARELFEKEARDRMLAGKSPDPTANLREGESSELAAELVGVSSRSIDSAAKVLRKGSSKLVGAVEQGDVSVSAAADLAELPAAEQAELIDLNDHDRVLEESRKIRKERTAATRAKRLAKTAAIVAGNRPLTLDELHSEKPFPILLVDPPWKYDFEKVERWSNENQYPSMDINDLIDMRQAIDQVAHKDCVLFLWTTAPKLQDAFTLLEEWDFEYKSSAVWDKQRPGKGYWFLVQHELLLVAVRGNVPAPDPKLIRSSVFSSPRGENSRKPPAVYDYIDVQYPSWPKLELFARGTGRPGWTSWGNQADKDAGDFDMPIEERPVAEVMESDQVVSCELEAPFARELDDVTYSMKTTPEAFVTAVVTLALKIVTWLLDPRLAVQKLTAAGLWKMLQTAAGPAVKFVAVGGPLADTNRLLTLSIPTPERSEKRRASTSPTRQERACLRHELKAEDRKTIYFYNPCRHCKQTFCKPCGQLVTDPVKHSSSCPAQRDIRKKHQDSIRVDPKHCIGHQVSTRVMNGWKSYANCIRCGTYCCKYCKNAIGESEWRGHNKVCTGRAEGNGRQAKQERPKTQPCLRHKRPLGEDPSNDYYKCALCSKCVCRRCRSAIPSKDIIRHVGSCGKRHRAPKPATTAAKAKPQNLPAFRQTAALEEAQAAPPSYNGPIAPFKCKGKTHQLPKWAPDSSFFFHNCKRCQTPMCKSCKQAVASSECPKHYKTCKAIQAELAKKGAELKRPRTRGLSRQFSPAERAAKALPPVPAGASDQATQSRPKASSSQPPRAVGHARRSARAERSRGNP